MTTLLSTDGPREHLPSARVTLGRAVVLAFLVLLVGVSPVRAQESVAGPTAECGAGAQELIEWCREIALAGQAARAGFGLLAAEGSEIPGSAGTLGWRLGSVPRAALGMRIGAGRLPAPVLGSERTVALPGDPLTGFSLQGVGAVGLFDGFSPLPTVGGLLSVDLVGTGSIVFLPEDRGFDGASPAYGIGARIGILRESFTLPGASVSVVQRWGGDVTRVGAGDDGGTVSPAVSFEPSTTSIRATVGKDLLAVGLLAGMGWDRYAGTVRIDTGVSDAGGGSDVEERWDIATDEMVDSRLLAFAGASLNFLILQISAEAGWAAGIDPAPERAPGGGFDPTEGSWFGGVGARLTY